MARRSDHNREELYKMALQAGREIVTEGGFRTLTARKVADRIGYSVGTLYNLFRNLDELALHLNASTLDLLKAHLDKVALKGDPVSDVNDLLKAYLVFIQENDRAWNMLFEHQLPEGAALPDWYQPHVAGVLAFLETALAPLFAGKEDPERALAARVLWASLHGICQLAAASKLDILSEETVKTMARSLVVNYVAGLQARLE